MAKEMLVHEAKFKESIAEIDALLKKCNAAWSSVTELNKPESTYRLNENPIRQTALFAIHFALIELLNSWGVRPSAVIGSLGEVSAAWASEALPLNKALQLVLFRSQLHEQCSPTGCMAAIWMTVKEARRMLQDLQLEEEVNIAVVNSLVILFYLAEKYQQNVLKSTSPVKEETHFGGTHYNTSIS